MVNVSGNGYDYDGYCEWFTYYLNLRMMVPHMVTDGYGQWQLCCMMDSGSRWFPALYKVDDGQLRNDQQWLADGSLWLRIVENASPQYSDTEMQHFGRYICNQVVVLAVFTRNSCVWSYIKNALDDTSTPLYLSRKIHLLSMKTSATLIWCRD